MICQYPVLIQHSYWKCHSLQNSECYHEKWLPIAKRQRFLKGTIYILAPRSPRSFRKEDDPETLHLQLYTICEPWCWNMNPKTCPNKITQLCMSIYQHHGSPMGQLNWWTTSQNLCFRRCLHHSIPVFSLWSFVLFCKIISYHRKKLNQTPQAIDG